MRPWPRSKLVGSQGDDTSVRGAGTLGKKKVGPQSKNIVALKGYKVGMRDPNGLGAGIGGGMGKTKRI